LGPSRFVTSREGDGLSWAPLNDQLFEEGPFEFALDAHNHIVYASNWGAGLWALNTQ
jgi:hypothetical protein